MPNTSMAIVRLDCSFLSVMKAILNHDAVVELRYGLSFAEDRIKDVVDNKMTSLFPPKQSRTSYIRYVRFARMMKRNSYILPLLGSESERWEDGKELGASRIVIDVLHNTRGDFAVQLVEPSGF